MKYTIPPNTVILHKATYKPGKAQQLLLELLEYYTAIPSAEIRLTRGPKGKPALDPPHPPHPSHPSSIHFNLSHSGDLAVYVFACGFEVGVDIEKVRPVPKALQIARRFFPEDEVARIQSSPNPELEFIKFWTRREALAKAFGVSVWDPAPATPSDPHLTFHEFTPEAGYIGCLAARAPSCNLVVL